MSRLAFLVLGSPASIPQQAGVSHESSVNLLPPSNEKLSPGVDFLKKRPGGIFRLLVSAHHRRCTTASASWCSVRMEPSCGHG